MKKKIYQFRLPEVQYLANNQSAFGNTWMEGQKLPVYALIGGGGGGCSTSTSSINPMDNQNQPANTELECMDPYWGDPQTEQTF